MGENIKTQLSDFTILDREIRERMTNCKGVVVKEKRKYYNVKCNKCGYKDGWKEETKITTRGCPCCAGHIAVKGINSVGDLRPDLFNYFFDAEDAYLYTTGSRGIVKTICPVCGYIQEKSIYDLTHNGFVCKRCSDGISYPEKFIMSFLDQAGINYQYQLSKTTFKWCGKYKYDFYIKDENCIIEVNGAQHYTKEFTCSGAKSLEEVQRNDKIKKDIALKNGIDIYIEIDCHKSEIQIIRDGIYKSKIFELLNIDKDKIDFINCAIFANKNLMKEVCNFYNKNTYMTPPEIAPLFKVNRATILKYLKDGEELGLCDYNADVAKIESRLKGAKMAKIKNRKKLKVFDKTKKYIGTFNNSTDASEYIYDNFGIKLNYGNISATCRGTQKTHKGFYFEYVA